MEAEYYFWAHGQRLGTYTFTPYTFTTASTNVYFGGQLLQSGGSTVPVDGLGSNVSNGKRYYPYGMEKPSATNSEIEKFTGYFRDSETGLDYARQRYYEPGYGRFITPDPAASGLNFYQYADGDPVNLVDRQGLNTDYSALCSENTSFNNLFATNPVGAQAACGVYGGTNTSFGNISDPLGVALNGGLSSGGSTLGIGSGDTSSNPTGTTTSVSATFCSDPGGCSTTNYPPTYYPPTPTDPGTGANTDPGTSSPTLSPTSNPSPPTIGGGPNFYPGQNPLRQYLKFGTRPQPTAPKPVVTEPTQPEPPPVIVPPESTSPWHGPFLFLDALHHLLDTIIPVLPITNPCLTSRSGRAPSAARRWYSDRPEGASPMIPWGSDE